MQNRPFPQAQNFLVSLQRQTITVLAEQMNGTVPAKKLEKTIIRQITLKSAAGLRTVMIQLTIIFVIAVFQKDTALVIGVDHIDLASALGLGGCRLKALCTNSRHTDIYTDVATHFCSP